MHFFKIFEFYKENRGGIVLTRKPHLMDFYPYEALRSIYSINMVLLGVTHHHHCRPLPLRLNLLLSRSLLLDLCIKTIPPLFSL